MAQIELRYATIRLLDGYSNAGLVNDTPTTGDTVIDIDTLTTGETVLVGTRFTFAGDSLVHYVTDQNADETQLITVDATSGNFTLGFEGTVAAPISTQTTTSIAEGATAAAVQAALEALTALVPGDVLVTGSNGGPFTVQFKGNYAGVNIKPLVSTNVDLMGGGATVVTTTTNTGGNTRQLTFTPAVATGTGVPANNAAVTFLAHTLEATLGDGTLNFTETINREYKLDRGTLDTVRNGDDVPMDVKLDFTWEFITAGSGDDQPTFEDALKNRNLAANWISSDTNDPCAPYAVDIEIEYVPPCGGEETETILLTDFRYESLDHNAKDAQISMSGKCNATQAVVSRS